MQYAIYVFNRLSPNVSDVFMGYKMGTLARNELNTEST